MYVSRWMPRAKSRRIPFDFTDPEPRDLKDVMKAHDDTKLTNYQFSRVDGRVPLRATENPEQRGEQWNRSILMYSKRKGNWHCHPDSLATRRSGKPLHWNYHFQVAVKSPTKRWKSVSVQYPCFSVSHQRSIR